MLPNLRVLNLSKTRFRTLPEEIFRFRKLIELSFYGNEIAVLPAEIPGWHIHKPGKVLS